MLTAKRGINQQQAARIQKIQAKLLNANQNQYKENKHAHTQEGLVIAGFGQHAEIENDAGARIHCNIRRNMEPLVAGDRVIWQAIEDGRGVILSLFPRTSLLCRADKSKSSKPVAANITQFIIVLAAKPDPSCLLLDSYLVMAECLHLKAKIVLNKIDLDHEPIKEALLSTYQNLNYPLLFTSIKDTKSYAGLEEALQEQSSVFVGQSGVGKSSLTAAILPHETNIQRGNISELSELGRHTTSNSRLYHLPKGGSLIDSPGIRELNLWQMPNQDVLYGFRELRGLASQCQFRNCEHVSSPGCAIIEGLREGRISQNRYENYIHIRKRVLKSL